MLQRGHSGDICVLTSTLGNYDLRKGDFFVRSWARVKQVRHGGVSSELLICSEYVHIILLLSIVARCLVTIDVYIYKHVCFYDCCSDCVVVCGNVCCVAAIVKDSVFLPWCVEVCYMFVYSAGPF